MFYKDLVIAFLIGVLFNGLVNGPHIFCCVSVQSVITGSLIYGILTMLFASIIRFVIGIGSETTMVSIGISCGALFLALKCMDYYSTYAWAKDMELLKEKNDVMHSLEPD